MKILLIVVLLSTSFACGSGFGHKLKSDKLEVYFDDKDLSGLADSLGKYWTKNSLVGQRKQSIKLRKSKEGFQVNVIASPEFPVSDLSLLENNLIDSLRLELQKSVFNNQPTSFVICNDEFKPIIQFKP